MDTVPDSDLAAVRAGILPAADVPVPGKSPALDELLTAFVAQKRMKLPGSAYRPCYRLVA